MKTADDYTSVTEVPGMLASSEQLAMMYTRYHLAARHVAGKDVLEVACGPGVGLGYMRRTARRVVGGDIEERNVARARRVHAGRAGVHLALLDAQVLPFSDAGFDVVLMWDSIYWLPDANAFLREARRVLRPGGKLMVSTVNIDWSGFNPHPFAPRYFRGTELATMIRDLGFSTTLLGAFPEVAAGPVSRVVTRIREIAVRFHLIPTSVRLKEALKRVFYGRLTPFPDEVSDDMTRLEPVQEIDAAGSGPLYKILYVIGSV